MSDQGTSFRDNAGRLWALAVNPVVIGRVRALTGVDLGRVEGDSYTGYLEAVKDVVTFVNVLYAVVKPEADRLGLTDEQFGVALVGDAVEDAWEAFQRAWAFFSPSRVRPTVLSLAAKGREFAAKAADLAARRVDAIDVDAVLERLFTSSGSATNSPPSPA